MSRVVEDDQLSDAPDTLEDERYEDLPSGIQQDEIPDSAPSRGPSISSTADQAVETASAHSLPAVTVSHHSPSPEPHISRTVSSTASAYIPPPSPARSHNSARPSTVSADDRRPRRRSATTTESRTPNRLSGFFNNLIHRREHTPNTEGSIREEHASQPEMAEAVSRPNSPPLRPTTPPPDLPAPSLQELGLCLSVLTSDLSPAHFSAPPSSGAFLAPHYLLLCHAQGLDVLPLISPPAPQPYALVRRVSFRSVVVMEQRGVLVAIAGRRDGVRVYALEEVKRAVEWRIEVELRRERERQRREASKKTPVFGREPEARNSTDKHSKSSSLTSSTRDTSNRTELLPALPLIPRTPTITRRPKSRPSKDHPPVPVPSGHPPPYASPLEHSPSIQNTLSPPHTRARGTSVSDVLTAGAIRRNTNATIRPEDPDSKADWVESSDDEAINIVAAGSSGSQALDERTSSTGQQHTTPVLPRPPRHTHSSSITRRNRPANLDLTLSRTSSIPPPEPSPAPTLLTLRQALTHSPSREPREFNDPDTPVAEADEDDDDGDGISLSQVLQESRLPHLPPPGTRQAQQPILLASGDSDDVGSPRSSDVQSSNYHGSMQEPDDTNTNHRRRWSVIIGQSSSPSRSTGEIPAANSTGNMRERMLTRSTSFRSTRSATTVRPSSSPTASLPSSTLNAPPLPDSTPSIISSHSSRSRFIPRILSNAFHNRRGDDRPSSPSRSVEESTKRSLGAPVVTQSPPPKLEYVKLPGTKGALLVKAVETAKKSFLAILCGDNGEKVELFAGTYRTALGLSRTFILPDSPRSLELQLQGDDLVEVFLVFSQNVFGLEPATVRVREVRIGRAERRAARRRAREVRTADAPANDSEPQLTEEENTNVNVSIGVSVAVGSNVVATGTGPEGQQTPPLIAQEHPNYASERTMDSAHDRPSTPVEPTTTSTVAHPEEIVALATAQMGPYTTFQQLSFAPQFPLASIADEYVIPPTYPAFIDYRTEYEPEPGSDLAQVQFSPPGLPVPTPSAPSKWFYRDPKNVIHGPWKASLMQAWYKDGLLPPDLPVRREEDTEFLLLKDLRLQSVDPTHPFRSVVPPAQPEPPSIFQASDKPLLKPISLLAQPRHFGPPALFFSSRGGHSTTIVDNRGRSVLKGRFMWSKDEDDIPVMTTKKPTLPTRMGDVKRLEAFDVKDRSVLVAMRQGGLEAVDLSDALLRPGDESRTALPQFNPTPCNYNRRGRLCGRWLKNSHVPSKKMSTGSTKSPSGRTEFNVGYVDNDMQDEVLFLGRKGDEIYICERNAGSFRILRLCPA
ncbi:hypothetical protein BDZ89DRAFT_1058955 [Hymenopellis radicata]|nr:hypothetical protein BDZ89DRAFT_1058955 [Hymenopellis radicata]